MKPTTFIEFYRFNPTTGGFDDILGSDGVAYLDGRWGTIRQHREAATIGAKRGYDGYRIARGTHTRPFYLTAAVQHILPMNVNQ